MKHFMDTAWRLLDRLLGQVVDHGPDISPQRLQQLTRRERQVAALVCLRYTNRQIARQLCISPDTVRAHARSALGKLGLQGRAALRQRLTADGLYGGDRTRMRADLGLERGRDTQPHPMRPRRGQE
jgi:DNA-binding CsgD family transcriptional regulator